jgi:YD repeat-containing protein
VSSSRPTAVLILIVCAATIALFILRPARASASYEVTHYGDFYLDHADVHAPGGLGMDVTRIYNSFDGDRKGIFGTGWGSRAEDYLKVQDDGSIVVHEYGGGANNTFTPTTSNLLPQAQILDEIMGAAGQAGQFGSEADRNAYRDYLARNRDNEEQAWETFVSLGLLKSPEPAVGETFFSGRFATEFLTRVPEGFQRVSTYNGQTIYEAFDLSGRLTRLWDANHDYVALTYGPDGRLAQTSDNEGHRFAFSFTSDGFVRRIDDSQGHVVQYQYSNDDLVSVDEDGAVTRYRYDSEHRLTSVVADGRVSIQVAYNEAGLATRLKDPDGTVTTYGYSTALTQTSRVDTVRTDIRKPNGESHHKSSQYFYEFDSLAYHLTREIETDDGVATDTTFDRNLSPLTVTTPQGTTSYTYDSLGRMMKKQMPSGTVYQWEYDPASGKVATATTTDKNSVLTEHFEYDPKGNLVRAYDSDQHDVSIAYDPYGRIATVTGSAVALRFDYADSGATQPSSIELAGTGSVRISYLTDGTVQSAKSAGGATIVNKIGASLKTVDDLIRAAGVDVITLPAPSS